MFWDGAVEWFLLECFIIIIIIIIISVFKSLSKSYKVKRLPFCYY